MDRDWWKKASGTMTHGHKEYEEQVAKYNKDTIVIVDFFMPQCGYCVKFMPDWNRVVEDMKAELGDKIQFLKVDGTSDRHTADRYDIESFPSFVALVPGTNGDEWVEWHPVARNYANMKKWIKALLGKFNIKAAGAPNEGKEVDKAAQQL